jgi:hypothetical protein
MDLTDLFLTATYNRKTCLTSQGEHAHIRPPPSPHLVMWDITIQPP